MIGSCLRSPSTAAMLAMLQCAAATAEASAPDDSLGPGGRATLTAPRPALLNGADATVIRIGRVAAEPGATDGPAGKWLAEDIRGGGVIDRLQTVLQIAADGTVTGTGGCNRMRGQAEIAGEKITFGPIAATRMACPAAVMDQENKFFAALAEVRTWKIDPVQQKLTLSDGAGQTLVVLTRM